MYSDKEIKDLLEYMEDVMPDPWVDIIKQLMQQRDEAKLRIAIAERMLTEGYDDLEYDLQSVNQAHQILAGSELPRNIT